MSRAVPSRVAFWIIDRAPLLVGVAVLAFASDRPAWTAVGWLALGLALLRWLAETNGYHLPRPGRTRVVTYGCWEQPQAFAVLRPSRTLLFYRRFEARGDPPEEYQVFALPPMDEADVSQSWGAQPLPEGHLLGTTPVSTLPFEHARGCWLPTAAIAGIESRLRAA
ncbi:MAG TPA: hypothetical protein VFM88_19545 [Vicinamibacteria bacterium]|nr:hypothetical protein [Vicinamibacteria bacterium]